MILPMKRQILLLILLSLVGVVHAQLSIEQCHVMAKENYPAIKKYGLIERVADVDLNDINKGWLPRIAVYGQGTIQNVVPSFPAGLSSVMEQMGQDVEGLGKLQYKVGVDVSQTIWDGGMSKAQRDIAESQKAVQQSTLEIELYTLRQKVENIYFAVLLSEEQIKQGKLTLNLLESNLDLLKARQKNGIAMQSDVDMVQAQMLEMKQSIVRAESTMKGYRKLLGLYIGADAMNASLEVPDTQLPSSYAFVRPELQLFDRRQQSLLATKRLTETAMMPKVYLFAQAFYGYPGFDNFKSIMSRDMTFNVLAGLKVSWNIDAFYTKKNTAAKTSLNMESIDIERETFLFNSRLQSEDQLQAIEGLKTVMADDAMIVELRTNVRKSAESQLQNGVIDISTLLSKITDENIARLTAKLHEIQYAQEIYKLKYTLNQ